MAEYLFKWPSGREPIAKIRQSDGCKGDTAPLALERWYDYNEVGYHLGNVGEIKKYNPGGGIMKSFSFACILFLALAGCAASEQGRWISLETDAVQDAKLTEITLPVMRWGVDSAVFIILGGYIVGIPDSELAKQLGNLAELYWLRKRYSDAGSVYGQVLDLREKTLGPEHPELARDHNNFALILASLGRREKAERHYKRALEIAGKDAGQNSDAAVILDNYAIFLRNRQLLVANPASSADFQKGLDAVRRGDFATALRELKPLAEQGHSRAQYHLGVMYQEAEGVPRDYAEAARWWHKAAERGISRAQLNLALMYANGRGVPLDYTEAVTWYSKAAKRGNRAAQHNLGLMYANGRGVPLDYATAAKWYREAAEQGVAPAQYNLGYMYSNGQGVDRNYKEAVRWYQKAAVQGIAEAQYGLGRLYKLGSGPINGIPKVI